MKKSIFLLFLFGFSNSFSQTIQGTVLYDGKAVPFVNVIIKKSSSSNIIYQYSTTDKKGFYAILLKSPLDSLTIEISDFTYEPQQKSIHGVQNKSLTIVVDFQLEDRITELKEIVIKDKVRPIKVKNDTTIYNPEKFKDGSERVVEDLLKKLPGIKVGENGEIKFNGKPIKKMLLDGDDLFDSQYTIGSRNINVDMLDKIEAIENFNENPLLKGLKDDEEVALNLKLKKGKIDFSGNATIGYGYQERHNYNASGILVNSKIKAFGISSYNNIGTNNSPYDFQSQVISVENNADDEFLAKEIINDGGFYSQLDEKFHRINSNFYTTLNTLYKFSEKITAKLNLGLYRDKLSRENADETFFNTNQEIFAISQRENIQKSPTLFNANVFLSSKGNKTSQLEYLGKFKYQEVDFTSNSINNDLAQRNDVFSKKWFTKHDFNFSKRINENSALTTSITFSKSFAPQDYINSPGIAIDENNNQNIISNNQFSRFDKDILNAKATYLNKFKDFKIQVKANYLFESNQLNSSLNTLDESYEDYTSSEFQNNQDYIIKIPSLDGNLIYHKNKFGLNFGIGFRYFDMVLENKISKNFLAKNDLIITPNLKLLYEFSKKSRLLFSYIYNQNTPEENNLFEGVIQTGFRSFQNNEVSLEYLKVHRYNLNFTFNDLFNLTRFSIGLSHNQRKNNYFMKALINNDISVFNSFLLHSGNKDYGLNISGEKYIHFLRTTFEVASNYSISFDKNIVNNSDLRDIESRNLMIELTARKGGRSKLFLENRLSYMHNSFLLRNISKNNFSSFGDALKAVYRLTDNFKVATTLNYIIPDLSISNNYYFLDSEITFTSKNKKFDYSIIGRNLTNNKKFETISISDYSSSVSSHNLIKRFLMASVSFKF